MDSSELVSDDSSVSSDAKNKKIKLKKELAIFHRHKKLIRRAINAPISKQIVSRGIRYLKATKTQGPEKLPLEQLNCIRTLTEFNARILNSLDDMDQENVRLKPRSEKDMLDLLRIAILRHDWSNAGKILKFLVSLGNLSLTHIFLKTAIILVRHHPESTYECFQNFIRDLTGYTSEEEIEQYWRLLATIRQVLFHQLKHAPNTKLKLIQDPMFTNIDDSVKYEN